jgi:glutathionylspermidine synthase
VRQLKRAARGGGGGLLDELRGRHAPGGDELHDPARHDPFLVLPGAFLQFRFQFQFELQLHQPEPLLALSRRVRQPFLLELTMDRRPLTPRPDWQKKVESLGFLYHTAEALYWNEAACYEFSSREVDELEAATNELHRLCLLAVQRVIDENLFARLAIPERFAPLIKNSWERENLSIYGRFDLCYDGQGPPVLYEYNADTPTSLLEASVIQWHWLEEKFPDRDQFNSIHEKLIARWKESGLEGVVHFACVREHEEDFANTVYMEDTAVQAGLKTKRLFVDEIGWTGEEFVDLQNERVSTLFKLYPWEWLIREQFGPHLLGEPWQVIEPAWKMILSNKGLLPLLWEMFPGHVNLLPAHTAPEPLGDTYVKKPLLGREGASLTVCIKGREITTPGDYGAEGHIYQAFRPPPNFGGRYPVVGSWIAQDVAAGIGIREGETPVTQNTSCFVPHYFWPA